MRSIETDTAASDPLAPLVRRALAFTGVLGILLVGIVTAGIRDSHMARDVPHPTADGPTIAMAEVAPGGVIDPAEVPEVLAVRYRGAEAHRDVFSRVPCFCGCATMLGHRHLLDCFVRPDGSAWEAHALGCGVCLGEAEQVLGLLSEGEGTEAIVTAVIDRWSDPYLQPEE